MDNARTSEPDTGLETKRPVFFSRSGARVLVLVASVIAVICLAVYLEDFQDGIPLGLIEVFLGGGLLAFYYYSNKLLNSSWGVALFGAGMGLVAFGGVLLVVRLLAHLFLIA